MPTPSIQTLTTDAQQVLNLDSISAVRSVVAVALANANTGTPLNPNLTTQQLWDQFYQVVTRPKSDIESIIANQLMKFLYAPPAPGGAGADKQVIFNDGGVLAGDADFLWNKTTNLLTVTGSATITGDLTVDTSTLKVDSANNRVGIGTATPADALDVRGSSLRLQVQSSSNGAYATWKYIGKNSTGTAVNFEQGLNIAADNAFELYDNQNTQLVSRYVSGVSGAHSWFLTGTTAMTLNSTGLGVGGAPISGFRLNVNNGDFRVSDNQNEDGVELGWSAGAGSGFVQVYNRTTSAFKDLVLNNAATITATGNVGIGVTPSGSGGCLQLKSGITFPATQVASSDANTLDDYEEGTFTPTVEGHTTAGTANYTVRLGQYTKIGRLVQFQLYVAWNSGTGTGQLKVTGLPFTSNGTYPAVLQVYPIDVALVAGYYATASVPIGTSSAFMYQLPIGGGGDASVAYDAAGQLIITGTYTV